MDAPNIEKSEFDEELEKFKDKILRLAGFQYTGLSITTDSNLYETAPYDFYGQFWDSDNLEELFTQGWLEYKIVGDDTTFEEALSVPENHKTGEGYTSNISYTDGYLNEDGSLVSQDSDYASFNSSNGYYYPESGGFNNEPIGEKDYNIDFVSDYYKGSGDSLEIIDYLDYHRNILKHEVSYFKHEFDYSTNVIEYWFRTAYNNHGKNLYLQDSSNYKKVWLLYDDDGNLYYYDSTDTKLLVTSYSANQWYHIRILWEEKTSSIDTFNLWIDGIKILDSAECYNEIGSGIGKFYISLLDEHIDTVWLDAWGNPNSPNYILGANYYWQYYLGSETFEEFNQSVYENYYGQWDYEDYDLSGEPGDYYGTESFENGMGYLYYSSPDSFNNQDNGDSGSSEVDWIDVIASSTTGSNQIISGLGDHGKCLEITSGGGGWYGVVHYISGSSGRVEYWFRHTAISGKTVQLDICDYLGYISQSSRIDLRADSGVWRWNSAYIGTYSANVWYRLCVEWYADNTFDFFVNDNQLVNGGSFDLPGAPDAIYITSDDSTTYYIDACGETSDPNYDEGDNKYPYDCYIADNWYGNINTSIYSQELWQYYHHYVLKMQDLGYYEYPGTYTFEDDEIGSIPDEWSYIEYPPDTTIRVENSYLNHNKVVKILDDSISYNLYVRNFFDYQTSGVVEYYQLVVDNTESVFTYLSGSDTGVWYRFESNGWFKAYDGTSNENLFAYEVNHWYHIKIVFDCSIYQYDLYIDGELIANDFSFRYNTDYIHQFRFYSTVDGYTESYIDAIGYSWDEDYAIGDNLYHTNLEGAHDFEDYNQSVYQNYFGTYDFENYESTDDNYGNYTGEHTFNGIETESGYFKGSGGLNYETVGTHDTNINWIDGAGGTDSNIERIIVAEEDGHNNVINFTSDGDNGANAYFYHSITETDNTFEWWWKYIDHGQGFYRFYIRRSPDNGAMIQLLIHCGANLFTYYYGDGGGGTTSTQVGLSADDWHHIKLDYSCTDDDYDFYLDGVFIASDLPFMADQTADSMQRIQFYNDFGGGVNALECYIDAPGLVGEVDPMGYTYEESWNTLDGDIDELLDAGYTIDGALGGSYIRVTDVDGHKDVLTLYDNQGDVDYADYVLIQINPSSAQEYGTIEYWVKGDDVTDSLTYVLFGSGGNAVQFRIYSDKFYYDDGGWQETGAVPLDNTWYHIRIAFECGSGGYEGLSADTWKVWINGTEYGPYDFSNNNTNLTLNFFYTGAANSNYTFYIDAVDFSWSTNYVSYRNTNPYGQQNDLEVDFEQVNYGYHSDIFINKTDTAYNNVLQMENTGETQWKPEIVDNFGEQTSGSFELWFKQFNSSGRFIIYLKSSGESDFIQIYTDGLLLKYWKGAATIFYTIKPMTWYHLKITFDTSTTKFSIYVNGTLIVDNVDAWNSVNGIDKFKIGLDDTTHQIIQVDAIDYSWSSSYRTYRNTDYYYEELINTDFFNDNWVVNYNYNCSLSINGGYDEHKKFLRINDYGIETGLTMYNWFSTQSYGFIEFYMRIDDASNRIVFGIIHSGANAFYFKTENDKWYYYDNTGYHEIVGCIPQDNTWHHIRIVFECSAGGYQGLSEDTYRLYIDGEEYGDYNFAVSTDYISYVWIGTRNGERYIVDIDALSYSWDEDYPVVGYNEFAVGGQLWYNYSDVSINNGVAMWIYTNSSCRISIMDDNDYISSIKILNGKIYVLEGTSWTYSYVYDNNWLHLVIYPDPNNDWADYYVNSTKYDNYATYQSLTSHNRLLIEMESGIGNYFYLDAYGETWDSAYNSWDNTNPYGKIESYYELYWIIFNKPYASMSVIDELDGHNHVLNITDDSVYGTTDFYVYGYDSAPVLEYGIYEFWIKVEYNDRSFIHYIYEDDWSVAIQIRFAYQGKIQIYDGSWQDLCLISEDEWYHVKLIFECTAGGFEGLSDDEVNVVVNGTDCGTYDYMASVLNLKFFRFYSTSDNTPHYYLSTVDFDWSTNYQEGRCTNPFFEDLYYANFFDNWTISGELDSYVFIDGEYDTHKSYLNFTDNSEYSSAIAYIEFDDIESGSLEFWVKSPPSGKNATIIIGKDSSSGQILMRFNDDDSLEYWDISWVDVCSIFPESWQRIRVEWNCITDRYNVYVNNSLESSNIAFLFGRDDLNRLTIRTSDYYANYSILVDSINYCWDNGIDYINNISVTCILDFNMTIYMPQFIEDTIKINIDRYHKMANSEGLILYLYDFITSSYVEISTDYDTSWADIQEVISSNPTHYLNETNAIILRFYSINRFEEFKYYLDECTISLYHKSLFNTTLTLYQMGIWKYRFHVHSVSLGNVYTDWVYFDVIEQPNNFEAISESKYATEWILSGTDTNIIENVIYQTDFTGDSWTIIDGIDDRFYTGNLYFTDDAYVRQDSPSSNYGSASFLHVHAEPYWAYPLFEAWFGYNLNDSGYLCERTSSAVIHFRITSATYTSGDHIYIYMIRPNIGGTLDEDTVTWNTYGYSTTYITQGTNKIVGWNTISFSTQTPYHVLGMRTGVLMESVQNVYISPKEGSYDPYIVWRIYKVYQNTDLGYIYYQTEQSELVGVKSPEFSDKTLGEGDRIVFDLETDQDDATIRFLKNGAQVKEMPILQYNSIYTQQEVQILIDEDVTFDQVEIVSNLNDNEVVKIYNIKMSDISYENEEEVNYIYLQPYGEEERLLPVGNNTLQIYENGILKVEKNITLEYYIKYTEVFESTFSQDVYLTLRDQENVVLDFEMFTIYANYTLGGGLVTNQRIFFNTFYADEGTLITFRIYDTFNYIVYSGSRYVSTFIDITLSVYTLKIQNKKEEIINYELYKDPSTIKTGNVFSEEIIEFALSNDTYYFNYTKEGDIIEFSVNISLDQNRAIMINASELCFLSYANQKGEYLEFNNYKTYLFGILLYINTFYEDAGINVSLEIKDRYDISILNYSYIVQNEENYIAITLTEYSLKCFNQQPYFNHVNITRDPNYYTTEAYWSEWMAPGEIVDFRLFPGYYRINFTRAETSDWYAYAYVLAGDDILVISSSNTIYNVLQNIQNVNTTIGNQITNVWIDLSNQNSDINNTIINIDISIDNLNSTLGNMLLYQNLTLTNIMNNISTLFVYMGNEFISLETNMNSSFITLESSVYLVNNTIYTAVNNLESNLLIINNTISGNITFMLAQNVFLTEMFQKTMFSHLLNWSNAAYNVSYLEEQIMLKKFINNYKDTTLELQMRYGNLTETLRLAAQDSKEQYLPKENVSMRVYSVSDGVYLTEWRDWKELSSEDGESIDFGFYEEDDIPETPQLKVDDVWLDVLIMIIVLSIIIVGLSLYLYRSRKQSQNLIKNTKVQPKRKEVQSQLEKKLYEY